MGVEPVQTFFGKGEETGQFFAILCGRLLRTVPKVVTEDAQIELCDEDNDHTKSEETGSKMN